MIELAGSVVASVLALRGSTVPQRCARRGLNAFQGPPRSRCCSSSTSTWEWKLARHPELATEVGRREHNARWTRSVEGRARPRAVRPARVPAAGDVPLARHAHAAHAPQRVPPRARHPRPDRLRAVPRRDVARVADGGRAQRRVPDHRSDAGRARWPTTRTSWRGCGRCPSYIDQTIGQIQEHVDAGLTQPAVVVDLVLDQLAAQRRGRAVRLAAARGVPAVSGCRFPAPRSAGCAPTRWPPTRSSSCRRGRASKPILRDRYRPRARTQAGPRRRGGADRTAYARLIQHYTTTSMSPAADPSARAARSGAARAARCRRSPATTGSRARVAAFEQELASRPGMQLRESGRDAGLRVGRAGRRAADAAEALHAGPAREGRRAADSARTARRRTASNYVAGTPTDPGRRGST